MPKLVAFRDSNAIRLMYVELEVSNEPGLAVKNDFFLPKAPQEDMCDVLTLKLRSNMCETSLFHVITDSDSCARARIT